jgi:hypothetical protein
MDDEFIGIIVKVYHKIQDECVNGILNRMHSDAELCAGNTNKNRPFISSSSS